MARMTYLMQLNFKYKLCNDERRVLMEQNDIVCSQVKFLRKMSKFKRSNVTSPIVCLDETLVNKSIRIETHM